MVGVESGEERKKETLFVVRTADSEGDVKADSRGVKLTYGT